MEIAPEGTAGVGKDNVRSVQYVGQSNSDELHGILLFVSRQAATHNNGGDTAKLAQFRR